MQHEDRVRLLGNSVAVAQVIRGKLAADFFSAKASAETLISLGQALEPTPKQKGYAKSQIYRIVSKLQKHSNLKIARFFVSGPFGRRTCLPSIEIDIVVFLRNAMPPYGTPNGPMQMLHKALTIDSPLPFITPHQKSSKTAVRLSDILDDVPSPRFPLSSISTPPTPDSATGSATTPHSFPRRLERSLSISSTISRISEDCPLEVVPFSEGDEALFVSIGELKCRVFAAPILGMTAEEQLKQSYSSIAKVHQSDGLEALDSWAPSLFETPSMNIAAEPTITRNFIRFCRFWLYANCLAIPHMAVEVLSLAAIDIQRFKKLPPFTDGTDDGCTYSDNSINALQKDSLLPNENYSKDALKTPTDCSDAKQQLPFNPLQSFAIFLDYLINSHNIRELCVFDSDGDGVCLSPESFPWASKTSNAQPFLTDGCNPYLNLFDEVEEPTFKHARSAAMATSKILRQNGINAHQFLDFVRKQKTSESPECALECQVPLVELLVQPQTLPGDAFLKRLFVFGATIVLIVAFLCKLASILRPKIESEY